MESIIVSELQVKIKIYKPALLDDEMDWKTFKKKYKISQLL